MVCVSVVLTEESAWVGDCVPGGCSRVESHVIVLMRGECLGQFPMVRKAWRLWKRTEQDKVYKCIINIAVDV